MSLYAVIESENIASIRVAEKNGMIFEKESVLKGTITVRIYSVSRNIPKLDWRIRF